MKRYKATTSAVDADGNLCYAGKTYGVRFERGVAIFDDIQNINKELGLTAEEVAKKLHDDFGYDVVELDESGNPVKQKK